jgi:hypothetical protein
MTQKVQIRLKNLFYYCLAFCLTVLLINSCKKTDVLVAETKKEIIKQTPQNFFNLPANTSPVLKRIAKELERQNKTNEFITEFIAKEGFPVWSKSRIERHRKNSNTANFDGEGLEDTVVYVPLVVSAESYVTGFLKATIDDSVDIKIFRQNDYESFPFKTPNSSASVTTAEEFSIRMMTMDRDVFGTTMFKPTDKRLFNNSTDYSDTATLQRYVTLVNSNGEGFADGTTINNYEYEVCWSIEIVYWVCPTFSGSGSTNMEGCSWYMGTMSYCQTYETGGGDPGGNPPGGGGGGGGGTWPFPPPGGNPGGGSPCSEEFGVSITNGLIPIECNPNGGNPWPPVPPRVVYLTLELELNAIQKNWLIANPGRTNEIYDYLQANNSAARKLIAKQHLEFMLQEVEYLSFVIDHAQTGDGAKVWWEDEEWLESLHYEMEESFLNFFLDATQAKNPLPNEFADVCAGLPSMIQESATGNKKERVGYVTLDGKFIYSSRAGSSGDVQPGVRSKNGQFYYNYKMNLGTPTQSYAGMITDPVRQEYWIPIRTIVHTHIPDQGNNGLPITTTNPEKSEDDHKLADIIQKNLFFNAVNLYVVELKDNGKFLVASFAKDITDYIILGDDLITPNPNACTLIY